MVKGKRKQLVALAAKKNNALANIGETSNSSIKGDFSEDDDWVIVKKQKITILVPPVRPAPQSPQTHQIQNKCRKTIKSQPQVLNEMCLRSSSADQQKNSVALALKGNILIDERIVATAPNPMKKPNNLRTASESPNQFVGEVKAQPTPLDFTHDQHVHGVRDCLEAGVQKAIKMPTVPQSTCHKRPTLRLRSIGCLNVGTLQNQRMRASNLEKKLEKAGGLSMWLVSLGLGQFVRMFQRKNVGKFQLLNLTMEKLKDMGANAVGPRRKLIHAIDCLSQPNCFKAF